MKIEISHLTRYTYIDSVSDSVNELRLTPWTDQRQSCYQHELIVEPSASMMTYEDYFGNRVHAFSVNKPHRELVIRTRSTVVTMETMPDDDSGLSPEEELKLLAGDKLQDRYIEYLLPSGYIEQTEELISYAAPFSIGDKGLYYWLKQLMASIHTEFKYDPEATHVHTTVSEMLRLRRGVCQDFAHLMIAVCRYYGIPARYVSGYHFVGDLQGGSADFEQASHAWIEAYVPERDWLGFDPTNNAEIGWRYVKLGHGRDYQDIVPVKGVYRGTGNQRLEVKVDVRRIDK